MRTTTQLTLVTIALALATLGSHAQAIINGSFETPGHSDPNFVILSSGSSAITGWKVGGAGIDWFTGSYVAFAGLDPSASDGNYKVDLVRGPGEGGTVSQIVTGLTAGVTYYVDFDMKVDIITNVTTVTATAGPTITNFNHTVANAWLQHELSFLAPSNSATITLAGPTSGAADVGVYVDNVRIGTNSLFGETIPLSLGLAMYPGVTIEGSPGTTIRIEWRDTLGLDETNTWHTATTLVLPRSPFLWFDTSSTSASRRLYRGVRID